MSRYIFFKRFAVQKIKVRLLILAFTAMMGGSSLLAQSPEESWNLPRRSLWLLPPPALKTDTFFFLFQDDRYRVGKKILAAENAHDRWIVAAKIRGGSGLKVGAMHDFDGHHLRPESRGARVNVSYQKNRFSFYGKADYDLQNRTATRKARSRIYLSRDLYEFHVSEGNLREKQRAIGACAAMSYRPDSLRTLSAVYSFSYLHRQHSSADLYHIFAGDFASDEPRMSDPFSRVVYSPHTETNIADTHRITIFASRKNKDRDSDFKAELSGGYTGLSQSTDHPAYTFDADRHRPDHMYHRAFQLESTPVKDLRPSLTYRKKSQSAPLIEVGLQPWFMWQKGNSAVDNLHISSGNWVREKESDQEISFSRSIYMGYLNYSGETGPFHYHASLDFEYMSQMLKLSDPLYYNIFDRPAQPAFRHDRAGIFPRLELRYIFDPRNTLTLRAGRDIRHPSPRQMLPFLYQRNDQMYHLGNPALKPEYIKSAEISFTKTAGRQKLKITGFRTMTDEAIFPVRIIKENKWIQSLDNHGTLLATGGNMHLQILAGSFSRFSFGGSVYDLKIRSVETDPSSGRKKTHWNLNGKMDFFPERTLSVRIEMQLHSGTTFFGGYSRSTYIYHSRILYRPKHRAGWHFDLSLSDMLGSARADILLWTQPASIGGVSDHQERISGTGPVLELKASLFFSRDQ